MFQMTQNQGLPESTDWYRLLGDNLPYYALLLFDRNLGYRLAQGSFLAAHGYEAAKILGQPVSAVPIFAGEVPNLPELCRLALQGQPHCVSWLADSVAYNLQILPVRDEQGEIGGGCCCCRMSPSKRELRRNSGCWWNSRRMRWW